MANTSLRLPITSLRDTGLPGYNHNSADRSIAAFVFFIYLSYIYRLLSWQALLKQNARHSGIE